MNLNIESIREEYASREENLRNLVAEKMITQAHANELIILSMDIFKMLRNAYKSKFMYDMLRAYYIKFDPSVIAADEQATDNFFPPDTNDFFNS